MRLTILVHGDSGAGKSRLFATAPGPRLMLDAEGRAEHLHTPVAYWDPREAIPEVDTDGNAVSDRTTVVVNVRQFIDMENAMRWLVSGKHPFRSVGLDSITEAQDRVVEDVRNGGAADLQDWGVIFDKVNDYILALKDLRTHPTNPVDVVVVTAGTDEKNGKQRPYVRGQLAKKLPYRFDVVGFLEAQWDVATQQAYRTLHVSPAGRPIEAKDGTDRLNGPVIINPNLSAMLDLINTPNPNTEVTP